MLKHVKFIFVIITLFASACSSSANDTQVLNLRIIHINDTHSRLDPEANISMAFDENPVETYLGGMDRMKTAMDSLRDTTRDCITLHAGDAVQGTYYFTFFNGSPDFAVLNNLGIDVMTFGNHEFDRGPQLLNHLIELAKFPIISSNIDFSKEPEIEHPISKYIIKTYGREKVGVIGVTITDTPQTSEPGPNIVFNDVTQSVAESVDALERLSVNKIIVLSHIGYDQDKQLAADVRGIDVIVGGHSHTLLGNAQDFANYGITIPPGYEYPSAVKSPEGKNVLVVQASCFSEVIGMLDVDFDKNGDIIAYSGHPILLNSDIFTQGGTAVSPDFRNRILELIAGSDILHLYAENQGTESIIKPYRDQSATEMKRVIANAENDINWDVNSGPGPLVADSMVWKTGPGMNVKLCIENRGAIRAQIPKGPIDYEKVIRVLPFGSTVHVLGLTGTEVKNALEDGVDFIIQKYHDNPYYPFVSGMKYTVVKSAAKGSRITDMKFKNPDGSYADFDMNADYRVAVNAFLAGGGDGFDTLKNAAGYRYNTGYLDFEVLSGYLAFLGSVTNPTELRITILP
jgi:5'-nucleotidase / UDP-sugar diphosphatase